MADWTGAAADQYISLLSTAEQVHSPAFAVGPNDELYAVWAQNDFPTIPYEVFFSKSTDNGLTWTGSTTDMMISPNDGNGISLTSISSARRIDIAVNSLGYIFVVWPEGYVSASFDTTIEVMMVMSTDGGNTWIHSDTDFPISDTLSSNTANTPNIAIDSDDNLHVIWNQNDTLTNKGEIFYSYSSDNGATWTGRSAERMISYSNNYSSFYSDIDVGPDDKIHIVWTELYSSSDRRVLYGVSSDGGATFSSETSDSTISYGPYSSEIRYPRVKAKPFIGHVHVIYAQNDTAVYVGTTDGGATWNQSIIYGGQSYDMYSPDIAVTTTGTMVALLDEQAPGSDDRQIFASYSFDYGLTWSVSLDPVSCYDSGANYDLTYVPSVLITNTDILHCIYSNNYPSSSASYQEMCYSRSDSLGILTGALRGKVTELDGTTPIMNVEVTILDSNSVTIDNEFTGESGEYFFSLEPGTYSAEFTKYTHHDTSAAGILIESNVLDTVDISMSPMGQGMISGHVYEQTGSYPLQSAVVTVRDQSMTVWGVDTTDAGGYYEFTLYPMTYRLGFAAGLFVDTTVYNQILTEGGSITLDINMTWAIAADDIGVTAIDSPADYMIVDSIFIPVITVENFGYADQTIDLGLRIIDPESSVVYDYTESGVTVDSLSELQVTLGQDFTPDFSGEYTLAVTVINSNDENIENDTLSTVLTAFAHQGYGGPDTYGYYFRDNTTPCGPEFDWIDISATGTQIEPDELFFLSDSLPIGFNMPFCGYYYNKMFVNSHGAIHLGIRGSWDSLIDCPIPDPTSPRAPMLMVFWDGKTVHYANGQGVYYQYFDEADVDYTVVQWNVSTMNHNDSLEFEVIMYENGRIVYQYNRVSPGIPDGQGEGSAIGLEFDVVPELYGISYLCLNDNPDNRLVDGLAIEWFTDIETPGSVQGTVTDGDSNPIEGVYAQVINLGQNDFTDIGGQYSLSGLYPCGYAVKFSHPDYADLIIDDVIVTSGQVTNLDVQLGPAGFEYLPGDANMFNGAWPPQVIGGDVTYLVNYFRGLPTNPACLLGGFFCAGDANGDCQVIGSDVTRMVTYFRGLANIVPCVDYQPAWPTPDDLPGGAPSGWPNCE